MRPLLGRSCPVRSLMKVDLLVARAKYAVGPRRELERSAGEGQKSPYFLAISGADHFSFPQSWIEEGV